MTTLREKAAAILAKHRRDGFDPDQPRDENGRWGSTGSGSVMKSKAGGLYETKRESSGKYSATLSNPSSSRKTKLGEHATEAEARRAAETHNAPREAKFKRAMEREARGVEHMRGVIERGMAEGAAASRAARAAEKSRQTYTNAYQQAVAKAEASKAAGDPRTAHVNANWYEERQAAGVREHRERAAAMARDPAYQAASARAAAKEKREADPERVVLQRSERPLGSGLPRTKTHDPSKPYGITTETRWNGGRPYKIEVQNKPLPLRYRK